MNKYKSTLTQIYEYSRKIGNHQPDINTPYWKYRDALKCVSEIILANTGAWDNKNPYQNEDQSIITDNFEKLEKLIIELG